MNRNIIPNPEQQRNQGQSALQGSQAPWGGGVQASHKLQPTVPTSPEGAHAEERKWQNRMTEHKMLHFPTQRPNEHVILLLRRHWTVLAKHVTQLIISLLLPPVVVALAYYFTEFRIDTTSPLYILAIEAVSLYYLFSFLAYFHDFVDYHLDIWVVTDQRVVSVEQQGLFNRVVSELNIQRIQDVSSQMKGKVQTFLDYGYVHIQTAGEQQRFIFEQVSHPAEVAKVILQVHDRAVHQEEVRRMREAEEIAHAASSMQQMQNPQYGVPQAGYAPQPQTQQQPTQYNQNTQTAHNPLTQNEIRHLTPQQQRSQLHHSPVEQKDNSDFSSLEY